MKRQGQTITIVAAMDENGGIGKDNKLPWNVPGELKHFKAVTSGEGKTVIMGRATWESLPGGKPLVDRRNIVLSRSLLSGMNCPPNLLFESSIEDAMESATDEVYVIGGAEVYKQFMPLADRMILTQIPGTYECDTFFPRIDNEVWDRETTGWFEHFEVWTYERKVATDSGDWVPEPDVLPPVSEVNPLNIDFGAIINNAEKRRVNLQAIGELIGHQAPVIFRELDDIRSTFEILVERFKALDAEGKDQLPHDVKTLLAMTNTHLGQIENMIDMSSYQASAWKQMAEKYGIKAAGRAVGIKTEEPLVPEKPTHNSYGFVKVVYIIPSPDWPEGVWMAHIPKYGMAGYGNNPNEAFLDWQRQQ